MTDLLKAHTLLVIPSDDLRGMLARGCTIIALDKQGKEAAP